jgi:YfiH family protein
MTATAIGWIEPEWPAPAHVRVISTLRGGGVSQGPYASLNLAAHVGDDAQAVAANRMLLREAAHLPTEPLWLQQVHGIEVVRHPGPGEVVSPRADAVFTVDGERVCAVMTADCLPVAFTDRHGMRIALAHAGWRGLSAGVLEATIAALEVEPSELHAWLGPAIGADTFEVGGEVREAFLRRSTAMAACFRANSRGKWQADLAGLARVVLKSAGLTSVHGGGWCTHDEVERFYSFRRDGVTGRMATLAWLA